MYLIRKLIPRSSTSVSVFSIQTNFSHQVLKITCRNKNFHSHEKYLLNYGLKENARTIKMPEIRLILAKTDYCASLGVPISTNYAIFFNLKASLIH